MNESTKKGKTIIIEILKDNVQSIHPLYSAVVIKKFCVIQSYWY